MSKKDIIDYVMETPGNTNKKVLGRLIDEVEGVKLPEVTEDDNGSVLTVVEGAWDKAEPSGGSESPLIITGTYEETDFVINDSSYAEIKEAFMAGRTILITGRNHIEYSMVIGVIHDTINNEYHVTTISYNYSTRVPSVHDFIGYDEDGYLVG